MTTYANGGYTVTVASDGAILVKSGDWLSKYSMAIHNDFDHCEGYFGRRVPPRTGPVQVITEIDLIDAGETIYYLPTYEESNPPADKPKNELTPEQKRKLVKQLAEKHQLTRQQTILLMRILNSGRLAQAGLSLAGVMEVITLPALGFAGPIAGALLGFVAAVIGLYNARNYSLKLAAWRAVPYAITAWAFNHNKPTLPSGMETAIKKGTQPQDLERYRNVWTSSVNQTYSRLRAQCAQKSVNESALKEVYRALGKDDPKLVALLLMDALADEYISRQFDRDAYFQPWSEYPNDRYAGKPGWYPPGIC